MATKPIELFYSYAHDDKNLLAKINNHLSTLKQEGLISHQVQLNHREGITREVEYVWCKAWCPVLWHGLQQKEFRT